jgi:polyhydroxyalkanoate synthesis regulator phasin
MKLTKKHMMAGVVTTVIAGSLIGANAASAQTSNGSSIVDKIVAKFNLNKDEVQAVFDEQRTEQQAERATEMSDRLQDKVNSGDITAEQKTLIEQKLAEQQTTRETERTELEKWASDNGVDMKYLMGGRGHMGNDDSSYLDDAVADGDITAEQKTLIEQKQEELQTKREANRDSLKQWADDNNIELKYVMGGVGGPGHGEMGGPGMMR